jgi:hypothetical protein
MRPAVSNAIAGGPKSVITVNKNVKFELVFA